MVSIVDVTIHDIRFPTSEGMHGSDAMHPDPDYSATYVVLKTEGPLEGHGLTFTIGRGNEVVKAGLEALKVNTQHHSLHILITLNLTPLTPLHPSSVPSHPLILVFPPQPPLSPSRLSLVSDHWANPRFHHLRIR